MSRETRVITGDEFRRLFTRADGRVCNQALVVQGYVDIDCSELCKHSLRIEGVVFTEGCRIHSYHNTDGRIGLHNCQFGSYLTLENITGKCISVTGGRMGGLKFWGVKLNTACLSGVEVEESIHFSGLSVSANDQNKARLSLQEVSFKELILVNRGTDEIASVPWVDTDDHRAAVQFRMLGSKVIVPTKIVEKHFSEMALAATGS